MALLNIKQIVIKKSLYVMDRKLPSEIIISDGSFLLCHKKNVYVKPKADRVTLDVDELMIPASPGSVLLNPPAIRTSLTKSGKKKTRITRNSYFYEDRI